MSAPLIEFRGVQKAFGPKVVYRDLNLHVEDGESLVIIGGSGQGKSVMLRMLIGLLTVDAGTVAYDGRVISGLPEREFLPIRREVQMLFQGAALFDSLSVGENVAYGLREQTDLPESTVRERVSEALTYVGLPGIEDMWPADLSGGMRKRVGLARAIAIRPRVLLYDEPTTGLDPVNVTRISELIVHLKRTLNVTSVVVTHDMEAAFFIADRMTMIHAGEVVFSGSPDEFEHSDRPQVRDFVLGIAPEDEDTETLLRSAG